MVQKGSKLFIVDNSGAKYVKCIRVVKKVYGGLGDFISVVLHVFNRGKKLVRKKKYICMLISVARLTRRINGVFLKFSKNRGILFFEKDKFSGTRIYGPICREIRNRSLYSRFKKLISYAYRMV